MTLTGLSALTGLSIFGSGSGGSGPSGPPANGTATAAVQGSATFDGATTNFSLPSNFASNALLQFPNSDWSLSTATLLKRLNGTRHLHSWGTFGSVNHVAIYLVNANWAFSIRGTTSPSAKTFTTADTSADTATVTAHGFLNGEQVTLSNSGGALPGGLTNGGVYFLNVVDANTLRFSTTYANAVAGVYVDLTTAGTGTQTITINSTTTSTTSQTAMDEGVITLQRNGAADANGGVLIEMIWTPKDGNPTVIASYRWMRASTIVPNSNPRVGCRGDQSASTFWWNPVSWFLKQPSALSKTNTTGELAKLAAGLLATTDVGLSPHVYGRFLNAQLPTDSSGNNVVITKNGTTITRGGLNHAGLMIKINQADFPWGRVYPSDEGQTYATVLFQGTYNGAPAGLEAAIYSDTDTQLTSFTTCFYPTTGAWGVVLQVPRGKKLTLVVRDTVTNTIVQRSIVPFNVGLVLGFFGESWPAQFTATSTLEAGYTFPDEDIVSLYDGLGPNPPGWFDATNSAGGTKICLNIASRLAAILGYPVGIMGAGYGGTKLYSGLGSYVTISSVDTSTDVITTVGGAHNYTTGQNITLVPINATMPDPLQQIVNYFAIVTSANTLKLATSYANAIAGIGVDITTTGVGVTQTYSPTNWSNTGSAMHTKAKTACAATLGYNIGFWWQGINDGSDQGASLTVQSVNTSTDTLTFVATHFLITGTAVVFSNSGGSLPGGISALTNYYFISTGPTTGQLSTTKAGALAGTGIVDLTSSGSGTNTMNSSPYPVDNLYRDSLVYMIPVFRTYAAYNQSTSTFTGRSAANTPFVIMTLGRVATSGGSVEYVMYPWTYRYIRKDQMAAVPLITNAWYGPQQYDAPLNTAGSDPRHATVAGYLQIGKRLINQVCQILGVAGYSAAGCRAAYATGATAGTLSIDITWTIVDGSALQGRTGANNLTGFVFKNAAGVTQTPTGSSIAGNVVTFTFGSQPGTGWTVDYIPDPDCDTTNNLYTNVTVTGDSIGMPVQAFSAPITL